MNMYDKLGSLLNETLEAGAVKFVRMESAPETDATFDKESVFSEENISEKGSAFDRDAFSTAQESKSSKVCKDSENMKKKVFEKRVYVYKKLTPELEHAYNVLEIPFYATRETVKKAYKEKLLYYHPDKHVGNKVTEKIATEKTSELIAAYNLLDEFLQQ